VAVYTGGMKLKMPSVKGMQHMEYLGHFSQDKWLAKGHNDVPDEQSNMGAALKSIREAVKGAEAEPPKAAQAERAGPSAEEMRKRDEAAARRSQESRERAARQARENDLAEQEKRPAREVE